MYYKKKKRLFRKITINAIKRSKTNINVRGTTKSREES